MLVPRVGQRRRLGTRIAFERTKFAPHSEATAAPRDSLGTLASWQLAATPATAARPRGFTGEGFARLRWLATTVPGAPALRHSRQFIHAIRIAYLDASKACIGDRCSNDVFRDYSRYFA